ncbi:MAG: type II toxin-antitoxin system Phd/YefM family antitoxin [Lachnospiraceae bacterium]|nr:type II toxin-antitoxin system Phd/YefM family antitoxin [Lachnospiraceae bacterium]
MKIDTNTMVSISDANQNFSKVTKLVDKLGSVLILKNNTPKYLILDFNNIDEDDYASNEDLKMISQELIQKNKEAYEELAK